MQIIILFVILFIISTQSGTAGPLSGHAEVNIGPVVLRPETPALAPKPEKLVAFVPLHVSAIGFTRDANTNIVLYIDPASDLYGKVFPGDIVLTIGGEDPEVSLAHLNHFGDINTLIVVVVLRHGTELTFNCHRHPLESFAPNIANGLRAQLCP
jgi:hypothetical protein